MLQMLQAFQRFHFNTFHYDQYLLIHPKHIAATAARAFIFAAHTKTPKSVIAVDNLFVTANGSKFWNVLFIIILSLNYQIPL